MAETIVDLEKRLVALEQSLVAATTGQYDPIEAVHDDRLASVEIGVGFVIEALRERVAEIAKANRELDRRVQERTRELRERVADIERKNALIIEQQEALQQLSTPVLRLWDQVIAMPIIGVIDTVRSIELTGVLLDAVTSTGARFAILDITGVEVVDTSIASHLIRVVHATRLLGAECILTGIQPGVAQALVGIGVDLGALTIRRDLQAALKTCLSTMQSQSENDDS